MSVFVQAPTVSSLGLMEPGRRPLYSFTNGASGRACSVSARTPACGTLLRQKHQQLCWHSAPMRTPLQVCAATKREREMQNESNEIEFLDFEEIDRDELEAFLELELESDYDFEDSRHYEIMFLVPESEVEKVPDVIKKVEGFVAENKGKVWRLNDWGLRRLAYKIKKASRANYVLMNIEIKASAINELNTMLQKDERVIRHICITQKEAITEASVPPPNYYPESGPDAEAQVGDDNDDDEEEEEEEDDDEEQEQEDDEEQEQEQAAEEEDSGSEVDSSEDEGEEIFEGQGRFVRF